MPACVVPSCVLRYKPCDQMISCASNPTYETIGMMNGKRSSTYMKRCVQGHVPRACNRLILNAKVDIFSGEGDALSK